MTRDEWETIAMYVENGWRGGLDDAQSDTYFEFLQDYSREQVVDALRVLVRGGKPFVPTVPEIVAAMQPECLSFDEVWPDIQGAMGLLRPGSDGSEVIERVRLVAGEHPAGWLASYGVWRLAREPVDDPEFGGAVVHRLREHYSELVSNPGSRDRLARALGEGPRRGELRRVDVLAALPERAA